jgi:hypothetical protein
MVRMTSFNLPWSRALGLVVLILALLVARHAGAGLTAICGDGIVDPGEECDDGGTCLGGDNAGTHCTADGQCVGSGVCVGGSKVASQCAGPGDCPGGTCEFCVPQGGDGCAANCTTEVDVALPLVPGVVVDPGIAAGTSGAVAYGELTTLPLPLTGTQTFTIGKERGGSIPLVLKAGSVQFPVISIASIGCACIRGVAAKTCGGTIFNADGTRTTDCTPGYTVGDDACVGQKPCAFVHGDGNSAQGMVSCAGDLEGVDISVLQDSGGSQGSCNGGTGGAPMLNFSDVGEPGSAIVLNTTAIATVTGACPASFCTDADPPDQRGTPVTVPLTTGTAMAAAYNVNCHDGSNIGPFMISGAPFDCTDLAVGSAAGGAIAGAFTQLDGPIGDMVVTSFFTAERVQPATLTPTPSVLPTATPTIPPTETPIEVPPTSTATVTATSTPAETPSVTPTPSPALVGDPGDANCDGRISAADLSAVLMSLDSSPRCSGADANQDGMVTIADSALIEQKIFDSAG